MAWIESHQRLATHPKTRKLKRELGLNGPEAVGYLHFLWWWALDFAQDGEITQYDAYDIADACDWEGEANHFFDALISSGFIDTIDDRKFIHDWYDYAGKLIEIRKKDAERKRKSRGKGEKSEGSPMDIQWTSGGNPEESIRDLNPNLNPYLNTSSSSRIRGNGAFAIYERQFGKIDEITTGIVADAIATYTEDWVVKAMVEAIKQKKQSMSYVDSILKRWKTLNVDKPWEVEKQDSPKQQQGYSRRQGQPSRPLLKVAKAQTDEATDEEMKRILAKAERLKA